MAHSNVSDQGSFSLLLRPIFESSDDVEEANKYENPAYSEDYDVENGCSVDVYALIF